jgi:hypothetical protein
LEKGINIGDPVGQGIERDKRINPLNSSAGNQEFPSPAEE